MPISSSFLYFGKYPPLTMKKKKTIFNPLIYFFPLIRGRAINKQVGKRVARLSISRGKKYKSAEERNTNYLRKEIQIIQGKKYKLNPPRKECFDCKLETTTCQLASMLKMQIQTQKDTKYK